MDTSYPRRCLLPGFWGTVRCNIVLNQHPCWDARFKIEKFSFKKMVSSIERIDREIKVRRITIEFINLFEYSDDKISKELDMIIMPRPWWKIVLEPYSWQVPIQRKVILERVNYQFENTLRFLSSVQYPDEKTCSKSPLLLGIYVYMYTYMCIYIHIYI
jgi:hypothetical protein